MNLIQWGQPEDGWMRHQGFMEWQCFCGAELRVDWSVSQLLYDTHEAITPESPNTSSWELVCVQGHTLLVCHEMGDDQGADTYEAPTTDDIAQRLATVDDLAAWRAYEAPKPPWKAA